MNYQGYFYDLLKQAFGAKQYKKMPVISKVFGFIGVFPFIVHSTVLSIFYSILVFIFNLLASSVNYLEQWVKSTKSDIKTPTEPILYFLTVPYIFGNHIILSLLSIIFFVLWFFMQCSFYIATLGATKWQPYITKVNLDDNAEIIPTTCKNAAKVLVAVLGGLFIVYITMYAISIIGNASNYVPIYTEALFESFSVLSIVELVYFLVATIAVPIVFTKKIVADGEEIEEISTPKTTVKALLATLIPTIVAEILVFVFFVFIPFGYYNSGVDSLKEKDYGPAYDDFITAEEWGITDSYKKYTKALEDAYTAAEELAFDEDYEGAYKILRHFEEVSKISMTPEYFIYKGYATGDYKLAVEHGARHITIPEGVTTLPERAFYKCEDLISVTLPSTLTEIGEEAFYKCTNLEAVNIPENVALIGSRAFYECSLLETILIPESVKNIQEKAFHDCDNLVIFCEANQAPSSWDKNWHSGCDNVVMGYHKITYSFHSNGGYKIENITSAAPIDLPTPVRPGYTFVGWYVDQNLVNKAYSPFRADNDITLFAKWIQD